VEQKISVKFGPPAVFFALGAFFLFHFGSGVLGGYQSTKWSKVEGFVLSSTYEKIEGKRPTYRPNIIYEFQLTDKKYESNKVSYDGAKTQFYREDVAKAFAVQFSKGPTSVYYNPNNPKQSVLIPGYSRYQLIPLGSGVIFLLCGLIALRNKRKELEIAGSK
jgi:hypothetical protein